MADQTFVIVGTAETSRQSAEQQAGMLGCPLYVVAARDVLSPDPGETARLVTQQVNIAKTGGAALLIQQADGFFSREPDQTTAEEGMMDPRSVAQKFADAGVPVMFAVEDSGIADRMGQSDGWKILTG